jgi:hypothetical protein
MPTASIVTSYLARGAVLWVVTRALVSVVLILARGDLFAPPALLTAVVLSAGLAIVETHQRREWALLGNLGVRVPVIVILVAIPPLAAEALLQVSLLMSR